ncbi:Uncharacterised protein [Mycobacterium tuberculosis]|nr:Uncharacterised protein [Mycobacterium tuberculosis]
MRCAEVLAHRDRFGEANVDLAEVAFPLRLDEVVEPAQTFGRLLRATRVGGVFGDLVQLIEANRNPLQQDVVTAAVQVSIGHVAHQTELGRQHLSGARPGAFDGPAQVEPLLDHVAHVLLEHVLIQWVVADIAPDEDHPRAPHEGSHETERQVDAAEHVHRR